MIIRPETSMDFEAIHLVHLSAFGKDGEARLVRALRKAKAVQASLVAEVADEIAGHILFSPVSAAVNPRKLRLSGLAPLGVAAAYHRMGIGSSLVREGLAACEKLGIAGVFVIFAATDATGQIGLMHRFSLAPDHGMLFVHDAPRMLSFWMRNTYIPLSIAFIDANGRIINIEDMAPQVERLTWSTGPALYALEMKKGWFAQKGIGPGAEVKGLPSAVQR